MLYDNVTVDTGHMSKYIVHMSKYTELYKTEWCKKYFRKCTLQEKAKWEKKVYPLTVLCAQFSVNKTALKNKVYELNKQTKLQ